MTDQKHPMNSAEFGAAGYRQRDFMAYYRFMRQVQALGATPAPGAIWRGTKTPFPLLCADGHACNPNPISVQQGHGICRVCARSQDSIRAANDFLSYLFAIGAIPLYQEWQGALKPHHVRCAAGHDCYPYPGNVRQGRGVCRTCARRDPVQPEKTFRQILDAQDARPDDGAVWKGVNKPFPIICAAGHSCAPRPANVLQGHGICETCYVIHDVLYVVVSRDHVKFGITSGDSRPRLAEHRRDGFRETVALYKGLPEGIARVAERAAMAACDDAGFHPVRGREYFPIAAMPVIVDVISGHAEAAGARNSVVSWTEILDNVVWSAV